MSEADIQRLVQAHPSCLPIAEIDPIYVNPVAICTELNTLAGSIDNFMVTPTGLPVLVECKLWRNPGGRREVIGQILDYAKELSKWSSSDVQREVIRRLRRSGDPILDLVRTAGHEVDEIRFNDALTSNLRRGRFLLLIVGDGIHENVEAITAYVKEHAGLHFSLGLVEMPFWEMPDGQWLVTPRVLAQTNLIERRVVEVPSGYVLQEPSDDFHDGLQDRDRTELSDEQQTFWAEFLNGLTLDDPEQPIPKPARLGYLNFMMPAPSGSSWLNVYRNKSLGRVGVYLSSTRGQLGDAALQAIVNDWAAVSAELGGSPILLDTGNRLRPADIKDFGSLDRPEVRAKAFIWLRERVNVFVNVLRPRIKSLVADMQAHSGS